MKVQSLTSSLLRLKSWNLQHSGQKQTVFLYPLSGCPCVVDGSGGFLTSLLIPDTKIDLLFIVLFWR
jgi:hypothetical protein